MNDVVYDIEDVKYLIEAKTTGQVVDNNNSVKFKIDTHIIQIDITDCVELPVKFEFKKSINAGCNPDKCITENKRTCEGCKLANFANMVEFKASLLRVKEDNKRQIAIFYVS